MKQIWLDTDIGDDVDDALALFYALASDDIDVIGISTVYKNTRMRTALARKITALHGREDIPVFSGFGTPLIGRADTEAMPSQCEALSADEQITATDAPILAVNALLDTIRSNPDLTVVTIGPLTNLAVATLIDPAAMRRARIVSMAGYIRGAVPEGNILSDPEAARLVLGSEADIELVTLDTTASASLPEGTNERIFAVADPRIRFLADLMKLWRETELTAIHQSWGRPAPTGCDFSVGMHDPLTVLSVSRPELFDRIPAEIRIETQGEFSRGVSIDRRSPFTQEPMGPCNCRLVSSINYEDVVSCFCDTILKEG